LIPYVWVLPRSRTANRIFAIRRFRGHASGKLAALSLGEAAGDYRLFLKPHGGRRELLMVHDSQGNIQLYRPEICAAIPNRNPVASWGHIAAKEGHRISDTELLIIRHELRLIRQTARVATVKEDQESNRIIYWREDLG
jgi:hypothetical protein